MIVYHCSDGLQRFDFVVDSDQEALQMARRIYRDSLQRVYTMETPATVRVVWERFNGLDVMLETL